MDRKDFIKSLGMASGCMLLFNQRGVAAGGYPAASNSGDEGMQNKFFEHWIVSLMENLEEHLEPDELKTLLEDCGRDCAHRSSVHELAESCNGDVDILITGLATFLGQKNCYRENDTVTLKYPKCYCELVDKGPEKLPGSYCLCSRGWVVEMFETAAKKPVQVELLKSVKRGDPHCEFTVKL